METTKPAGKKSKKGAGNLKGFIRESKGSQVQAVE